MQPLSATDAVTPAFTRTRQVLQPFRFGRSWKLAASAYVGRFGSVFIPWPLLLITPAFLSPPEARVWMATGAAVLLALMLAFFYVFSRMQFVAFDIALTQEQMIAPIWRRYAGVTWPWTWLKVLIGTAGSLAVAPLFYISLERMIVNFKPAGASTQPDPSFFFAIFGMYFLMIAFFLFLGAISSVLSDFVLPFLAVDRMPILTALGRGFDIIKREPVSVLAYFGMKILLAIAGYIAAYVSTMVVFVPLYIVMFVGVFVAALVRHAGPTVLILAIVAAVVVGLVFIAALFYVTFLTYGGVTIFLQAYAIYFLAGRYPALGDLLEPPIPLPDPPILE